MEIPFSWLFPSPYPQKYYFLTFSVTSPSEILPSEILWHPAHELIISEGKVCGSHYIISEGSTCGSQQVISKGSACGTHRIISKGEVCGTHRTISKSKLFSFFRGYTHENNLNDIVHILSSTILSVPIRYNPPYTNQVLIPIETYKHKHINRNSFIMRYKDRM